MRWLPLPNYVLSFLLLIQKFRPFLTKTLPLFWYNGQYE